MGDTCSAMSCKGCRNGQCNCHEIDMVEIMAENHFMQTQKRRGGYNRD